MSCPECGSDRIDSDVCGQWCDECGWEDRGTIEAPEGGWPRGSDMDRI